MGLSLALSGIVGADSAAVEGSVDSFVNAHSGTFEARAGTTDDPNIAVITQGGPNTTILFPREFMHSDVLSQHLSKDLQVPVFSFHIHDGDLWMFLLFDKGEKVTQFNSVPEYWRELDSEEKASWLGDAEVVCRHIAGLSPESIRNYFIEWTDDVAGSGRKAYPDDEFAYGQDWQMTDFMRRVDLKYPVGNDGNTVGKTFRIRVRGVRYGGG
jgi:hypothetical protein